MAFQQTIYFLTFFSQYVARRENKESWRDRKNTLRKLGSKHGGLLSSAITFNNEFQRNTQEGFAAGRLSGLLLKIPLSSAVFRFEPLCIAAEIGFAEPGILYVVVTDGIFVERGGKMELSLRRD